MARADSKTAQLRPISVGANSLSKPLEAAGRPSCERRPPHSPALPKAAPDAVSAMEAYRAVRTNLDA
jgi:hypothetical protein